MCPNVDAGTVQIRGRRVINYTVITKLDAKNYLMLIIKFVEFKTP